MLQDVLKKYQHNKKVQQKTIQFLKDKIQQEIQINTIKALKLQNHKVSAIHQHQQEIQNKLRRNSQLILQLRNNIKIWVGLYQDLNRSLKQAGDLVNYSEYITKQIDTLETVLTTKSELQ